MNDRKLLLVFGLVGMMLVTTAFIVGAMLFLSGREVGADCSRFGCSDLSGLTCMHADDGAFCTERCDDPSTCPEGWFCDPSTVYRNGERGNGGRFCMRPVPGYEHLRSGTATVTRYTGSLPVHRGRRCTYEQTHAAPQAPLNAHWTITCGENVIYGGENGGFTPLTSAEWPPGVLADDALTSSADSDPAFRFGPSEIVIRDDGTGRYGPFELVLELTPR